MAIVAGQTFILIKLTKCANPTKSQWSLRRLFRVTEEAFGRTAVSNQEGS